MTDPLDAMAERARREPAFLGSVLERLARAEGHDDAGLAAALGCEPADLTRLRLCRAPREDRDGFREDVALLVAAFGLDPTRLAEALKRATVLAGLQARSDGAGLLMAARDREGEA